jgi:hypothetical protein
MSTEPQNQKAPPVMPRCTLCKFHVLVDAKYGASQHLCSLPEVASVIDGSAPSCHQQRSLSGLCGHTAVKFIRLVPAAGQQGNTVEHGDAESGHGVTIDSRPPVVGPLNHPTTERKKKMDAPDLRFDTPKTRLDDALDHLRIGFRTLFDEVLRLSSEASDLRLLDDEPSSADDEGALGSYAYGSIHRNDD